MLHAEARHHRQQLKQVVANRPGLGGIQQAPAVDVDEAGHADDAASDKHSRPSAAQPAIPSALTGLRSASVRFVRCHPEEGGWFRTGGESARPESSVASQYRGRSAQDRPAEQPPSGAGADPVLSRGLLFTPDGEQLVPSLTVKKGKTYPLLQPGQTPAPGRMGERATRAAYGVRRGAPD
jgi:hypothetical protein